MARITTRRVVKHQTDEQAQRRPPVRIGFVMNVYSLLIAVLPILVIVLIALNLFSHQIRDQVVDQMTAIALLKSREIDRWLETSNTTLDLVLTNPDQYRRMVDILETPGRVGVAGRNVTNFLQSQLNMQTAFDEFFLYNLNGEIRLSTDESQVNVDLIEQGQPYVESSMNPDLSNGEEFIPPMTHPAYYDPISGEVTIIITQPLLNETTGAIVGALAGRLSNESLSEIMTTRDGLGETGETYLVSNQYSNFITPSRFEAYDPVLSYVSVGIDNGLAQRSGADFYENYRGRQVIGVYRWVPALDAALVAEIEEAEALSAVRDVRDASIIVALITGVVVLIIGQGVTRWLTRPIGQLTQIAQAVMGGDLTPRANLRTANEIGQLGHAFDTMTTELVQAINERNVRIKQIEELSETLESRVEDRTRDLQVAATVARQITTVLDVNELLKQVVLLTVRSFDLYTCGVFNFDEEQDFLHLAAGVDSEGNAIQLGDLETIAVDREPSIVARAARTGDIVVVNDVQNSEIYLAHDALPGTRSEMAIPLQLGNRILGIFDLQASQVDRFGDEEINVLTTLAEQISVAMHNAHLFAEAEVARAEAEQANQVKSQFLASMSHELRTPLNAILNFTEFVADGVLGNVNEEQVDALNKAIESGEHLLSLINDILDLTKIEVGMMELFIEEVNINKTLESVLATAKGLVSEKPDLEIVTKIDPDLPIIAADKRRIRQIMLNLISNAVKFTPHGTITITTRRDDGDLLLSIQDTGVGIPPDEQEMIFESFRQAGSGRATGVGTGLGLPITRYLVEAHNGEVWMESEVNVGSTFYVRLPVRRLEQPTG
jgi:signal transduction histidine kinase/HAMP domain-containing protein